MWPPVCQFQVPEPWQGALKPWVRWQLCLSQFNNSYNPNSVKAHDHISHKSPPQHLPSLCDFNLCDLLWMFSPQQLWKKKKTANHFALSDLHINVNNNKQQQTNSWLQTNHAIIGHQGSCYTVRVECVYLMYWAWCCRPIFSMCIWLLGICKIAHTGSFL